MHPDSSPAKKYKQAYLNYPVVGTDPACRDWAGYPERTMRFSHFVILDGYSKGGTVEIEVGVGTRSFSGGKLAPMARISDGQSRGEAGSRAFRIQPSGG